MRGFMRFVRSSRLLMVGAIAFIITLAAALAAFLCDRLGVGVPWLPAGLHAVSALSGLTAGASPVLHSDIGWQYRHPWWRERLGELGDTQCASSTATSGISSPLHMPRNPSAVSRSGAT